MSEDELPIEDEEAGEGEEAVEDEPNVAFFWGRNLFDIETEGDENDPPGYRARGVRVGPLIRGEALGAGVYDLDPGQSICPFHYELGNEEWLLVLVGRPTVLDEDGDPFELKPWDVAVWPEGPEGAHKVTNNTEEPVRVAIFSTKNKPSAAVYPDSNKIGIFPPGKIFRLDDAVDYWEGEAERVEKAEEAEEA